MRSHPVGERIPVGTMTVLVCAHGAERALLKTVDQSHAQDQDAVGDVMPSLTRATRVRTQPSQFPA